LATATGRGLPALPTNGIDQKPKAETVESNPNMKITSTLLLVLLFLFLLVTASEALQPEIVYSFVSTNGATPVARLVQGSDGYLYGITTVGGTAGGFGTVFRASTNGALNTLVSFNNTNGAKPEAGLTLGSDGNFYGTTTFGGISNYGTIYKISTNGNLTLLASFLGTNGAYPRGTLALGIDGNFYGTTYGNPTGCGCGGFLSTDFNNGTIFRVSTNGVLTMLVAFNNANGAGPYAGLTLGNDGSFYGTTTVGGVGYGTVFKVTTNGVLTSLVSFNNSNGANPWAGLTLSSDGSFYGSTYSGGTNGGYGTLYNVTTNGLLTSLVSLANTNGANPYDPPTWGSDGKLYGTTMSSSSTAGTIFRMTTNGTLTKLVGFSSSSSGDNPLDSLILATDGIFYGTAQTGGASGDGTVFKTTTNGTLTAICSFTNLNGATPSTDLTLGPDGKLYGTTKYGGNTAAGFGGGAGQGGAGTLFSITTNGQLTQLHSFTGSGVGKSGALPVGRLVLDSSGNIYGTAQNGGRIGNGTVFKTTTNGTMTILISFTNVAGALPEAGLAFGSDGNLYGTTDNGGINSKGTVFMITTNGNQTLLFSFTSTNGFYPQAALTLGNDCNFYGTTSQGGNTNLNNGFGYGTVFRITPMGVLTTLISFNNTNGAQPQANLALGADGNFYGTTRDGGNLSLNSGYGYGTVFKITTNGALTTLVSFALTNGYWPQAGLSLGNDGNFYGTTTGGGDTNLNGGYGYGSVFKITTTGVLTTLANFNSSNGQTPNAGVTLGSDGNFYGTTAYGGAGGIGTIYRVGNPPFITIQPISRANLTNTTANFIVTAVGGLPLSYQWLKNNAPLSDTGNVSGSSTTTLNLASVSNSDKAGYSVAITNNYGAVTSSIATLAVLGSGGSLVSSLQVGALGAATAWTPFIKPPVMGYFPVVSVCCFASTQGSGGRRA
jgi:uncharacterized repeat protein (TIGR03803 family)